jgi:hypothetical protein
MAGQMDGWSGRTTKYTKHTKIWFLATDGIRRRFPLRQRCGGRESYGGQARRRRGYDGQADETQIVAKVVKEGPQIMSLLRGFRICRLFSTDMPPLRG